MTKALPGWVMPAKGGRPSASSDWFTTPKFWLNIHFQTMKLATSGVITGRKIASLKRVRPRTSAGWASEEGETDRQGDVQHHRE